MYLPGSPLNRNCTMKCPDVHAPRGIELSNNNLHGKTRTQDCMIPGYSYQQQFEVIVQRREVWVNPVRYVATHSTGVSLKKNEHSGP